MKRKRTNRVANVTLSLWNSCHQSDRQAAQDTSGQGRRNTGRAHARRGARRGAGAREGLRGSSALRLDA